VLAKRKWCLVVCIGLICNIYLSFFHQARPNLLSLLYTNGKFDGVEDDLIQFCWQVIEHQMGFLRINFFPPPVLPLAWDVSSADDLDVRVDEEEYNNLAVAWFRRVCQLKRTHTVLKDVGESQEPTLTGVDASNFLCSGTESIAAIDIGKPSQKLVTVEA